MTFEKISAKQLLAFKMEFAGKSRRSIAKATGFSENTLNAYFARNGLWYKRFRQWREEKFGEISDQVETLLLTNALEALRVLGDLMNNADVHIRFKAAVAILDRAGFKKNSNLLVQYQQPKSDPAEEMWQAVLKIEREKEALEKLSKN